MLKPECRQSPRMTLEELAYISLEADNGGIVLNISDGGLCFHAVAPVQRTGTIRFWFSAEGRRIEADGELVWTDATRKTGGLRFTAVSAEAREQMRIWMVQSARPLSAERKSLEPVAAPHALPGLSSSRPSTNTAPAECGPPDVLSPKEKAPTLAGGFHRGLVTGIVISALVAGAFLFHAYRRQFGESLIRLGERFGAKPQSQAVAPAPAPIPVQLPVAALKPKTVSPAPAPVPIPVPRSEKLLWLPLTTAVKSQQANLEPAAPATAIPSTSPMTFLPTVAVAPDSNLISGELGSVPQLESANRPTGDAKDSGELGAGSPSGKYLQVGRFKGRLRADEAIHVLAQLGFHAIVIHEGHLWMNSHRILVGPYGNDDEAEAARMNLESRGFKPRSLARKSRRFRLPFLITPYGTDIAVGRGIISWESYSPDATVKFVKGRNVVAAAQGKWVKRGVRYSNDGVVYEANDRGPRTLLEIRCNGMKQVFVLGESKPIRFFTPAAP